MTISPEWRGRLVHGYCLTGLVAASVFLYGALLHHQVLASHEGLRIPLRTYEYVREIGRGHWIPQVFPDASGGVAYAFPRFYAPAAYLISAGLAALTGDVVWGTNLAFFFSVLCSGLAMYHLVLVVAPARKPLVALATSLIYVALPYRFVDVFVRGALAEAWTFAWYPLIAAATWQTLQRRAVAWYLPVALGGLMLTHTISFLYFALLYGAVVVAAFVLEHRRAAARLLAALALGSGFALWFLVPQLHALSTVPAGQPELMWSTIAEVDRAKVPPSALLGIGSDLPAEASVPANRRLHLDLGAAQLIMPVVLALFLVPAATGTDRRLRWLLLLLAGAWASVLLFMIEPRPFLRALPSAFAFIQFPWRLLGLAAFLASAIIGLSVAAWRLPRWATGLVVVGSVLGVLLVPGAWRSPSAAQVEPAAFSSPAFARAASLTTYTDLAEYRPIELPADRLGHLPSAPRLIGDGTVSDWRQDARTMTADVTMHAPGVVVLPVLFYDFYAVRAGTRRLPAFSAEGLLAVRLPAGHTTVSVDIELTPWSRLGLLGTAASLGVFALQLLNRRQVRRLSDRPRRAGAGSRVLL